MVGGGGGRGGKGGVLVDGSLSVDALMLFLWICNGVFVWIAVLPSFHVLPKSEFIIALMAPPAWRAFNCILLTEGVKCTYTEYWARQTNIFKRLHG